MPETDENGVEWLTPSEAAARLHIGMATLARYRKAGKIPAYTIPGVRNFRYKRHEIDAALTRVSIVSPQADRPPPVRKKKRVEQ